jgi:hypothetical protein
MKFKKHIKFKDGNQIWRILISPTEKLIIETRNTEKKEAFFSCIDLQTSKKLFKSFQFPEKYWIGIEDFYNNTMLLHRFAKPDMPGHKSIIAFDLATQNILWENENYAFLFMHMDKIYTYSQRFEGRQFFTLNPSSGEIIEDLGTDQISINEIKYKADEAKDYSKYIFPEAIDVNNCDLAITEIVKDYEIVGDIEFAKANNFLIFNFHSKIVSNLLENKFYVYDTIKEKLVIKEIINSSVVSAVPDSFFFYDKYLILIKEKSEVIVYKME